MYEPCDWMSTGENLEDSTKAGDQSNLVAVYNGANVLAQLLRLHVQLLCCCMLNNIFFLVFELDSVDSMMRFITSGRTKCKVSESQDVECCAPRASSHAAV